MTVMRRCAYAFGHWNRERKAQFAIRFAKRAQVRTVLLVGVDGNSNGFRSMNMVERRLAAAIPDVVASGLAPHADGWDTYVQANGLSLPFADDSFDLVYANAVIEHVGSLEDQQRFIQELDRVGRSWVVTTPNRWFPVEAHYHTVLSHWRNDWCPRGTVTRLLGRRDLEALLTDGQVRGWPILSPTLTAFKAAPVREQHRALFTSRHAA